MKRGVHSSRHAFVVAFVLLMCAMMGLSACQANQQSSGSSQAESKSAQMKDELSERDLSVPNVVGLTQDDAKSSIIASGFKLGEVTVGHSDSVPSGNVISQKPEPLTIYKKGSSIDIVVSDGQKEVKEVRVPNLKGMDQGQAEQALEDVGLVPVTPTTEETTESRPGVVFKQSVNAGEMVEEGTRIKFTIAAAPTTVSVPNVIGMTEVDAESAIRQASLGFDIVRTYSDTDREGVVVSQSVDAGTTVNQGQTIVLSISLGPAPPAQVTVPDVSSYSWADAESTLKAAGLGADYVGDVTGTVASQNITAGTSVDEGTIVTVTLEIPVEKIAVPDLVGKSVMSAEIEVESLGLVLDAGDMGGPHGTVDSQSPEAGTEVEVGSTISVTIDTSDFE